MLVDLAILDRDYGILEAQTYASALDALATSNGTPWAQLAADETSAESDRITALLTEEALHDIAQANATRDFETSQATAAATLTTTQSTATAAQNTAHSNAGFAWAQQQLQAAQASPEAAAGELPTVGAAPTNASPTAYVDMSVPDFATPEEARAFMEELRQAQNMAAGLHPQSHQFEAFRKTWVSGHPPLIARGGLDLIFYTFAKPQELASGGIEGATGWSREEQIDVFTIMTTRNPNSTVIYDQERLRRDPSRGTAHRMWYHFTDPWTYGILGAVARAESKVGIVVAGEEKAAERLWPELLARYQAYYNEAYSTLLSRRAAGNLAIPEGISAELHVGRLADRMVRLRMRNWLADVGVGEGPGAGVRVNRWLLDPSGSGKYRIPDLRVPGEFTIIEGTTGEKTLSTLQIQEFISFSEADRVIIVRPFTRPQLLYPRGR